MINLWVTGREREPFFSSARAQPLLIQPSRQAQIRGRTTALHESLQAAIHSRSHFPNDGPVDVDIITLSEHLALRRSTLRIQATRAPSQSRHVDSFILYLDDAEPQAAIDSVLRSPQRVARSSGDGLQCRIYRYGWIRCKSGHRTGKST